MPLGPPNLCAEIATRSTPAAASATSSHGTAWTASVWTSTAGARSRTRRTISSSGWIVPTSLLTSITDTTAVRSSTAAASASRSTTPVAGTASLATRKPSAASRSHDASTPLCSNAVVTTPSPPPAARARAGRALHREVVGLGAAGGEHDLAGLGAEERRDLLPGLLERGLRRPGRRVAAARVAERAPQERRHRRDRLGPHRGGRGVVEVGDTGVPAGCVRRAAHRSSLRSRNNCHTPGRYSSCDHATAPGRPPRAQFPPRFEHPKRASKGPAKGSRRPGLAAAAPPGPVALPAPGGAPRPGATGASMPAPAASAGPGSPRPARRSRPRSSTPLDRSCRRPADPAAGSPAPASPRDEGRRTLSGMGDSERPTRSDWEALAAKEVKGDLDALTWHTPEGIDVKPLYTAEDLEGLEAVGALPGLRAVRPRRPRHDVREPALDDPPVRRLLDRRGVERLLPGQPRRRADGPVGGVRPRHPPRLRQRPPTRRRRRRQGRRRDRLGRGHEGPLRRHPARQDDASR